MTTERIRNGYLNLTRPGWMMVTVLVLGLGSASLYAGDAQKVAFVTSVSGNGNFSSWPDSGNAEGLEAADEICVARATAAGLPNPLQFVAVVSDSSSDAYCRIHDLLGVQRAANCGQPTLPINAGPWMRTDGTPFGARAVDLFAPDHVVYTSLLFDEFGNSLPLGTRIWTATGQFGELSGATCDDWASTSGNVFNGQVDRTSQSWIQITSGPCSSTDRHLYCMQTGPGAAAILPPEPIERLAFTTNEQHSGDLSSWTGAEPGTSGIEAGDSICNSEAEQFGLPNVGSYKAWLSDDSVDARDRFVNDGPWFRVDGFRIADNIADLIDGELFTSNNVIANGTYRGNFGVWTGTNPDGTASGNDCGNWESTAADGSGGAINSISGQWTDQNLQGCTATHLKLYCFSDVPWEHLLIHGFE